MRRPETRSTRSRDRGLEATRRDPEAPWQGHGRRPAGPEGRRDPSLTFQAARGPAPAEGSERAARSHREAPGRVSIPRAKTPRRTGFGMRPAYPTTPPDPPDSTARKLLPDSTARKL